MPNLDEFLESLMRDLILAGAEARETGAHFETLSREMESMKIDVLQNYLEKQRKSAAHNKGMSSIIKDRTKLRNSLLVAGGCFILGSLLTRDKFSALNAGISSLDGMVEGFGESNWRVLLGKKITVVPGEWISPQVTWITLASFNKKMKELRERAVAGAKLGTLVDIIARLKTKRG